MPSVRTVLVPVDGSKCSMRALRFAVDQQQNYAEVLIRVLYVQLPLPHSRFVTRGMINRHFDAQAQEVLNPVHALIKRTKCNVRVYAQLGDPAKRIITFARKSRSAQIVMGNSGRGSMSRLLLGSVAARVMQLASCPVTVVK